MGTIDYNLLLMALDFHLREAEITLRLLEFGDTDTVDYLTEDVGIYKSTLRKVSRFELKELYADKEIPTVKILKHFKIATNTLAKLLDHYGITRRSRGYKAKTKAAQGPKQTHNLVSKRIILDSALPAFNMAHIQYSSGAKLEDRLSKILNDEALYVKIYK